MTNVIISTSIVVLRINTIIDFVIKNSDENGKD